MKMLNTLESAVAIGMATLFVLSAFAEWLIWKIRRRLARMERSLNALVPRLPYRFTGGRK